jgi:hypothetical protein
VVFVQLKQYHVPAVKSPLPKVTDWPEITNSPEPVGAEIVGQAVAAVVLFAGSFGHPALDVPFTVQLPTVEFTVKPVGNVTFTDVSVAVDDGLAHTVPDVKTSPAPPVDCLSLSNRTSV